MAFKSLAVSGENTSHVFNTQQCHVLISTLFVVCVLVMFSQEAEIQLDYFSPNFIPIEHEVEVGVNQQPQQQ
ncbi:hypothetical protein H920_08727 [Fukomys damarensis]|uniref:Uncharacterized protein n=1 Tax=Fukomys damarensis TaxID=885580 RepID=A0A091DHX9_FUKDA|nr:hypothetical protein H920_08727 [Fukomys damarensis]